MKRHLMIGLVLAIVAVAGFVTVRAIADGCCGGSMSAGLSGAMPMAQAGHDHGGMMGHDPGQTAAMPHATTPPATQPTLADVAKAQTAKLAEALTALDAAKNAIRAGDNGAALTALDTAKAAVAAANDNVAKYAAKPETATNANIEYYCPMHPKVVKDAPGNCPICGMALSKRAKTVVPGK